MIAILCLGVAAYLAIYLVRGWKAELATTRAYTHSIDVGQEAQGILVRTEIPLAGGSGYVDQILPEGAKAAAGDAVALLYGDPSALTTRQSIRTLEAEIEQLQYALESGSQNADAARLDQQVISSIVSLRSLAAGGDLTGLDDCALNLRSMVFKRDYAYGDTGAAEQLGQLITDKQAQLAELYRSLNQVSTTIFAPASGVYSAGVDGWEGVVTPPCWTASPPATWTGCSSSSTAPPPARWASSSPIPPGTTPPCWTALTPASSPAGAIPSASRATTSASWS